MRKLIYLFLLQYSFVSNVVADSNVVETEKHTLRYEIVTEGLAHPWSLAFLPDGEMLVTERSGKLRKISKDGVLNPSAIQGLPEITAHGQGGLLDVVLHPQYSKNQLIYFSYAESEKTDNFFNNHVYGTSVARARLVGNSLKDVQVIFRMKDKTSSKHHFGSRLVFSADNHLFITTGDRGDKLRAQDLNDHAGSLIRIYDDGGIPDDNPFVNRQDIQAEIFSYGHRNMQGAALNPYTKSLWIHEHGPQGGDEINIPQAGKNYGWPVITYGVNYGTGTSIGEGTHKKGMQQPVYNWVPSIAPSGMTFYDGVKFPEWQGNLFIGSLKFRLLVRLELKENKVIHEERILNGLLGRIRDVRQGPEGFIYLLTDDDNGKLIRLTPER